MPENTAFGDQTAQRVAQDASVQQAIPAAVHGMPATIPASSSATSNLILSDGYQKIAVGATLSNAGTLSILRYLDDAGTILQTQFTATNLTAATPGVNNVNDGLPFASFRIRINNSVASIANISNFIALMQAQ